MVLNIHDFPIKFEDNCIKNCKGKILFNLKKGSKDEIVNFIQELIPAINHGKRVFKKRLQKSFIDKSLKESIKIVKNEMINKGFILSEDIEGDIEYNVISKKDKNNKRLNFNIYSNKFNKKDKNIKNKIKNFFIYLFL